MVDKAVSNAAENVVAAINGKALVVQLASMAVVTAVSIAATAIVIKQIEKRED